MKYLNLTEGFNPYDAKEKDCIKYESFLFNGGEPHIKINLDSIGEYVDDIYVSSRLTSMNDLMMLAVASNAIAQSGKCRIRELFIPYVPGARQDRRMIPGEPLSAKVFCQIINDLDYDCVTTYDNHSDVSTALIDNCNNLNNHEFVYKVFKDNSLKGINLVSPDAGSNKKIKDLGKFLWGYDSTLNIVKCDKTRDVSNGNITGFEVYTEDLKGKDCIVVDDICDGGGTFIGLAKELKKKGAGDIYLIVSHGIFSKPLKELKPYFKKIYTTDSWRSEFSWEQKERDTTDLVEIIKFKDFM